MLRALFAIFGLGCATAFGGFFFSLNNGMSGGGPGGTSISINADWGETDCVSGTTCTVTSPSATLTVPVGNPGGVTMLVTGSGVGFQYCKNGTTTACTGGTWTSFSTGQTLTALATGNTLYFRRLNAGISTRTVVVIDTSTSATVGDCTLTVESP